MMAPTEVTRVTGTERISAAFSAAKAAGRAAVVPYVMAGWPDRETSVEMACAMVEAGADVLEVGMPFSDPLADGPTIQNAATRALEQGMTTAGAMQIVADLRARGVTIPIVLMGYLNPLQHMGIDHAVSAAHAAGADGFIVADAPLDESGELDDRCADHGMALIPLVAPTSTAAHMRAVAEHARGFCYCVSVAGTTGARRGVAPATLEFLDRARAVVAPLPTVVGFGIATPADVAAVAPHVDGVVFASALIDRIGRTPPAERVAVTRTYVTEMRAAAGVTATAQ